MRTTEAAYRDGRRVRVREGRRHVWWVTLGVALVVAGIVASTLGARTVASNDRARARATFVAAAHEVAATLTLALQHEEDLAIGARADIVGDPRVTQAAFLRWTRAVEALARYPELEGGGEVVEVPAARLPAFAARQQADPATQLRGAPYQVMPPGHRPYYCLVAVSFVRHPQFAAVPAGLDFCAWPTSLRTAFLTARDSGRNAYLPFHAGRDTVLVVQTPVYRGGVVPRTLAARRRAFLGAFGTTVVPRVILDTALRGHPHMTVEFGRGSSPVAFRSGVATPGAQSATIDVHYGWTVRVSAAVYAGGLLADRKALALLAGGLALSAMLGLLMLVLGTGRARALAMVRRKTSELHHQALHDGLTGLPNRALVLDRAERMLARARREPGLVVAALFVDIDRFKRVNDTYGHSAGDRLLQTVARRLREVVREQDTVGRLGGDEFVVLLESTNPEAPPDVVAERMIHAVRRPVVLDDEDRTSVTCRVSIGIAIGQREHAEELLRDADLALYAAKAEGKDRAVLFEASMQSTSEDRLRLEVELADAVRSEQLFLLYQPIFDLDGPRMVGVEALVRWRHPERGVVVPGDFLPVAEDTGQIASIGRWVLGEACRQAAAWHAQGRPLGVAVNVSAYQLGREGFVEDVRRALRASGVSPAALTLEIAETALTRDVAAASERLRAVRALGVRIAIDDFGTGFSSLAYLRQFAPNILKIDRSFVAGVAASQDSAAIVHTLVALGRTLHIKTLAEGIETPEQLEVLRREGCDQGQGYLFARPLPAEELEGYVAGAGDGAARAGADTCRVAADGS